MHLTTPAGGLGCRPFIGGGSFAVYLLFYVPPIFYGGSVLVFVLVCTTLACITKWCNHLDEEERAGCFALIVACLVIVNVM